MYQPMNPCRAPSAKMPESLPSSACGICPAAMKKRSGKRKTAPMKRPMTMPLVITSETVHGSGPCGWFTAAYSTGILFGSSFASEMYALTPST